MKKKARKHIIIYQGNLQLSRSQIDKGLDRIKLALYNAEAKAKSKAGKKRFMKLLVKAEMYKGLLKGSQIDDE